MSSGSMGNLCWSRKHPGILVKKYKTRNMEETTEAMARIHQAAETFIASCGTLSEILEILPMVVSEGW